MNGWSVYIHFPYCLHRCAYCDFATAVVRDIPREAYRDAILTELAIRSQGLVKAPVQTVFFGGGTPSLWGPQHIGAVLAWLAAWSGLASDAEITLEANPGALEAGDLEAYAAAGINRVSVGVQALEDRRLRALDRLHDAGTAHATLRTLGRLLAAGTLKSANADLIFGGPGQTMADLQADVKGVLDHGLPHLSAYSLTVESGTPLYERVARGLQSAPDEGLQGEMLEALPQMVAPYGLSRYEVSNFARTGHRCRHNLAYWTGQFYLSAGVGAHGYLPETKDTLPDTKDKLLGWRYGNVRGHKPWLEALQAGQLAEELREPIDEPTHRTERLLTELRLTDGLNLLTFQRDFGVGATEQLLRDVQVAVAKGLPLRVQDDRVVVAQDAMRRLDGIILALV